MLLLFGKGRWNYLIVLFTAAALGKEMEFVIVVVIVYVYLLTEMLCYVHSFIVFLL